MKTPSKILASACETVELSENRSLPFYLRGIKVNSAFIEAVLAILNECHDCTLPQNCRNDIRERTPDGLDRRIKEYLGTDLRTANIISDVLSNAGIVQVVKMENPVTGRLVKGARLLEDWRWNSKTKYEGNKVTVNIGDTIQQAKETGKKKADMKAQSREDYLRQGHVQAFIKWLDSRLDGPEVFQHQYYLKKRGQHWQCSSLYEAYEKYWWPYNMACPVKVKNLTGGSFSESFNYLTDLAVIFRASVKNEDMDHTLKCAYAMLKWGGVLNKNWDRVLSMGDGLCHYFTHIQKRLKISKVLLENHDGVIINSGFTKLYFLLVNDFVMYDGRVGAALGLLSRLFAEEQGLEKIPREIGFSFGSGRVAGGQETTGNRRDPSRGRYKLPTFNGNSMRHLHDNINASWLLKELADKTSSPFAELDQVPPLNKRLTALQSALFMVGYDVRDSWR